MRIFVCIKVPLQPDHPPTYHPTQPHAGSAASLVSEEVLRASRIVEVSRLGPHSNTGIRQLQARYKQFPGKARGRNSARALGEGWRETACLLSENQHPEQLAANPALRAEGA